MAESFLLDTSALLALVNAEPGMERVRELLLKAKAGEALLHASFVSLAEVQYIKTYDEGQEAAERIVSDLKNFPIAWLHSDEHLCASAAEWKANHKISLGDSFIVASTQRSNAVLVHKDPEFVGLPPAVRQEVLPLKVPLPHNSTT